MRAVNSTDLESRRSVVISMTVSTAIVAMLISAETAEPMRGLALRVHIAYAAMFGLSFVMAPWVRTRGWMVLVLVPIIRACWQWIKQ